jgi:hypothetical protein
VLSTPRRLIIQHDTLLATSPTYMHACIPTPTTHRAPLLPGSISYAQSMATAIAAGGDQATGLAQATAAVICKGGAEAEVRLRPLPNPRTPPSAQSERLRGHTYEQRQCPAGPGLWLSSVPVAHQLQACFCSERVF